MSARRAWPVIRSMLWWGIPAVLVAALIWTMFPRGGAVPRAAVLPRAPAGARPPAADPSPPPAAPPPAAPSADPSPPPAVAPPAAPSAEPGPGTRPFAEIHQGDLEGTDETGRPQWRIVADVVTVVHDKNTVLLQNVRATLYERGGGTIVVTGARGRFDMTTQEVQVDGSVHGKSSTGRELFTDSLRWRPRQGRVTGTGHVRLIQERVVMYADGMTSDTILGQTQFFGHVRASVR